MNSSSAGQDVVTAKEEGPPRLWILISCCLASVSVLIRPPLWVLNLPVEQLFGPEINYARLFGTLTAVITVLCLLAGGILGDLYGRRRILLIGLIGISLADLLAIAIPNLWWFAFTRVGATIFGSFVLPLALALINITFSDKGRGPALAIFVICGLAASQLAWVQGSFLLATVGWRAPYLLPIIISGISIFFILKRTPETAAGHRRFLDSFVYMGWTLIVLAALYGLLALPVNSERWRLIVVTAVVVGIAGVALLLWSRNRPHEARKRRRHIRTLDLVALLIVGVLLSFAMIGFALRTFAFFRIEWGYPLWLAMLALSPILVGAIFAIFVILRNVYQRQARLVIAGGLFVMGCTAAWTALLPANLSYIFYAMPITIFGMGYILAQTVWVSAFLRTAIHGYYGLNAAINKSSSIIGGALGAAVTGNLLAVVGNAALNESLMRSNQLAVDANGAIVDFHTLTLEQLNGSQNISSTAQPLLMTSYLSAYGVAYDSALWLIAGVTTLGALIILLALRRSLRARRSNQQIDTKEIDLPQTPPASAV